MNILDLLKQKTIVGTILTEKDMSLFLEILGKYLSTNSEEDIRILTMNDRIHYDKNCYQYTYANDTDIMCHEKWLQQWVGTTLEDIVNEHQPCLCFVRTNAINGKLLCVFCSIYDMPRWVAAKITPYLDMAIAEYFDQQDHKKSGPRKDIVTELIFENGSWTKWIRFIFNEPTSEEDFKVFLIKENLWFAPQDGETLEIRSTDGGTVWTYYAEKGQLPE